MVPWEWEVLPVKEGNEDGFPWSTTPAAVTPRKHTRKNKHVAYGLRPWLVESDCRCLNADLDTYISHDLVSRKVCISALSPVKWKWLCPLVLDGRNRHSPWLLPISMPPAAPLIKKGSLFPLTIGWPSDSFGQQNSLEVTLYQLQDQVSRDLALFHSLPRPWIPLANRVLLGDEQSHGPEAVNQPSGPTWDYKDRTELSWDDQNSTSWRPGCQETHWPCLDQDCSPDPQTSE